MKKILSIILVLTLILSCSLALSEINLSEMTYDELIELQRKIVKEIMSRPEWKEVEVPAGQYTIGEDIPAGWYSVTPKSSWSSVTMRYYPRPNDNYWNFIVISDKLGRFEFYEGLRIMLDDTVIFAPVIPLGF